MVVVRYVFVDTKYVLWLLGTNCRSSVYILQHTLLAQHSYDFVIHELTPVYMLDVRIA